MQTKKQSNRLINQSSPYLLQHAYNPVDWYSWGDEALTKAKKENKLLIISIGYSACHWCHVMEHESFEDQKVADYMNTHFISIKVDREERPDVDQVYMNAVQLLSGQGGWPLNVIALPDGRPVYGGTYFPKSQWLDMLAQLVDFAQKNPDKMEEYARNLSNGVIQSEIIAPVNNIETFTLENLNQVFNKWKEHLDMANGGNLGAPKFPMPVSWQFLLIYSEMAQNTFAEQAVFLTLDKMAMGGIYDQIGGGFARYSTDAEWKVPHFEKMLYDNGQLVSLYAEALRKTKKPLYEKVIHETLMFVAHDLISDEGGFYSALDADSEGEEGKYYVWTKQELDGLLGDLAPVVNSYYSISKQGNWEDGVNVLHQTKTHDKLAEEHGIDPNDLAEKIDKAKALMLKERMRRPRPSLDDKILTSWNAMMSKAFVDAYRAFDNKDYLKHATENIDFLLAKLKKENYRLERTYKHGKSAINGFLDDYAFLIDALIALYQATFIEQYLMEARGFTTYVLDHFTDDQSSMFYYTSDLDNPLIARKHEISDNVIPSSNSVMAKNLYVLGHYFENNDYIDKAKYMLSSVREDLQRSGAYFANWGILKMWMINSLSLVKISGSDIQEARKQFDAHFIPNVFYAGSKGQSKLPSMKGIEPKANDQTIYVCKGAVCKPAVYSIEDAMVLLK